MEECRTTTECLPTDQCHRNSRDRDFHRLMEGLLRSRVKAQVHRWVGGLGDLDLGTHGNSSVTVTLSNNLIPGDQVGPLHLDTDTDPALHPYADPHNPDMDPLHQDTGHLERLIKEGAQCLEIDPADGMEATEVRSLHPLLLVSRVDDRGPPMTK
jgi:hypothetical protein